MNQKIINIKKFCIIPWIHLNFRPTGKVIPCCMTGSFRYIVGDLKTDRLDDIWNSEKMRLLRKEFLDGKQPIICQKCFSKEKATGESNRTYANDYWKEKIKEIPIITTNDGYCKKMDLKYWDFRFSNICNFKCRMCDSGNSSSWTSELKQYNHLTTTENVSTFQRIDQKPYVEFLKKHIHNVDKIYFAGGEPLIMDQHYEILKILQQEGRFDVKIQYNTNLSILEHNSHKVLDYWIQWQPGCVEIWPSIDEIGARAELIRKGTEWPRIENNLRRINHFNFTIIPHITTGAMNVFRLPEIITYFKDLRILHEQQRYQNFYINLIEVPRSFHICVLSNQFKQQIKERIINFILDFKKQTGFDIYRNLEYVIKELDVPHETDKAKEFIQKTRFFDKIRNEDTLKIIPELADVIKSV